MKNILKGKKKETKKESPVLSESDSTPPKTEGATLAKEEQDFLNGNLTPEENKVLAKAKEGKVTLSFSETLLKRKAERKQKHYARQQKENSREGGEQAGV